MNEELLSAVTAKVLEHLSRQDTKKKEMESPEEFDTPRSLLLGQRPVEELGYSYVECLPYEAVVIGSLTVGQLLYFRDDRVFDALLEGKPVYLYLPGVPKGTGKNRHLEAELVSALNRLRGWGIIVIDSGVRRRLITAQEARRLKARGLPLPRECILTPSARDILM